MANYDANFPADDEYLIDFPSKQRNQQEALKDSAIVNAGKLQGKVSGNNSDNIPINNGTVNTNLNADMLDGKHANELSLVGHTHNDVTTSASGFMSGADKTKLNGIATGAEVNQNAFSNIKVGTSTVQADSKTDTLELVAGSNVTLTPDTTNDKITITSTNTVTTATTSGSGNAVTSITANNGALTVTKGTTFLTSHQNISGKANLSGATFTGNIGVNLSSGEANITAKSLAGSIYIYATGSNTGNRGIYGVNASGTGQNILQVAQNGTVTIPNLSGYSASNHTHSNYLTGITKAQVTTALGYTPPTSDTNTWRPLCSTKPTTTSTASANAIAVVTTNYINGNTWYRVWSDGWIEEGGRVTLAKDGNSTVTLPKAMVNAPITVIASNYANANHDSNYMNSIGIYATSNTQITLTHYSNSSTYCWYACGY